MDWKENTKIKEIINQEIKYYKHNYVTHQIAAVASIIPSIVTKKKKEMTMRYFL